MPTFESVFDVVSLGAKQALCVVLFWRRSGLNRQALAQVGIKPFALAIVLWISLAAVSFLIATN